MIGGTAGDQFFGTNGRNEFVGGPGSDRYLAAGGDDLITDLDGTADRVDCGPGVDTAVLDLRDVVVSTQITFQGRVVATIPTCENVTRAADDDGPPPGSWTVPFGSRRHRLR